MGFLEKVLMIYLCLAIATSFFNPSIVLSNNNNNTTSILGLFDVGYNTTTNEPYVRSSEWGNEEIATELDYTTSATTGGNIFKKAIDATSSFFQWMIDGLANVMNVIKLMAKFAFSPFLLFTHIVKLGAPFQLLFIFAIPLTFMFILAFIRFIRGGTD